MRVKMAAVLTVTQINTYIKSIIDYDGNLKNIYVSGEISNFTNHFRSGHFYFTIKDENSAIKAVMFKNAASRVRFEIENGMKVIVRASVSVFERDGVYQLYVDDIAPDGIGQLTLAFEQLKKKLFSLGLFDETNKKKIPRYPEKIGVITSATGAAVQDIKTVLSRRYPLAEIVLEDVLVQGENASEEIAKAVEKFNFYKACDVIILGRGGGSIEDLWAFNEERVAFAVYNSEIPIISGVGHETDYTICDYVADVRAATPSAAAEIAVPDYRELLETLDGYGERLHFAVSDKISEKTALLSALEKTIQRYNGEKIIEAELLGLSNLKKRLEFSINSVIERKEGVLIAKTAVLEALSPINIISKGFAVVYSSEKKAITSIKDINENDDISLRLTDGEAKCKVISKSK